jgi:hypothetical protein
MNASYMTGASGLLADFADLLSRLDLVNLPPLAGVDFDYSCTDRTWTVSAQISHLGGEENAIDAVRAWAVALNGDVHLGDQTDSDLYYSSYRHLEAVKALEFGASFHVWTHVAKATIPAAA